MLPIEKIAYFPVLLNGILSFNKSEISDTTLNIDNLPAFEILSNQDLECRSTSGHLFYVASTLVKKQKDLIL